jgi:hypothetical protein
MTNDQPPNIWEQREDEDGIDLSIIQSLLDEASIGEFERNETHEVMERKWGDTDGVQEIPYDDTQSRLPGHILIEKKPEKRKMMVSLAVEDLTNLIGGLPPVDTDYYIISNGTGRTKKAGAVVQSFGFGAFISYVVEQFGDGCIVDLSTWSMNKDHVFMILELLDSRAIERIRILCANPMQRRKWDEMATLINGLKKFKDSKLKLFKNHSKVYCIRNADSTRFCTITGSANLSGNPRAENYVISTSPDLYHSFYHEFFEVMFCE